MSRPFIPNAWPLGRTFHVARGHPAASDQNAGDEARPLRTISAAARVAQAYDRIVIDEGIYREQVDIVRAGDRGVERSWIVFSAAAGKEVYVKGSAVFETDWEQGGLVQIPNTMGSQGVGEPQACQLPDGRIFVVLRQAIVLPSQDGPGYPSVKLFSVSDDCGRTWSDPRPLTFDDGRYVYSSTSFASSFRSSKNDRVYVILNILNGPNEGCLPRNVLHIARIDPETLCVRRDTVTVVEEVHEEHTAVVGYSNWGMFEDRDAKSLVLIMNLENGPVGEGYDWNAYRYEITFAGPES